MRRSLGQLVPRRPPSARAVHPPRAGVRPLLHPRQLESRAPPRGGGPGPLSRVWLRPGIPAAAPAPAPPAVGRALGGAARVRGVPRRRARARVARARGGRGGLVGPRLAARALTKSSPYNGPRRQRSEEHTS